MCEWLEKNKEKNFLIKDNIMLIYIIKYILMNLHIYMFINKYYIQNILYIILYN